jgi:hypothetical protein
MAYHWPADTDFAQSELDVLDRSCPVCGRMMHIRDHRYRRFHTLDGPVPLVCKLNHCPDPACPGRARTKSPELELTLALPQMAIGWDVLRGIGHRRCSRLMAVPLIRSELLDDYRIARSEDAIEKSIRRYQAMLAARQQDPEGLRRQDAAGVEVILSIDGLQPEKGHETLYVVRELTRKRVWFAEPLISSAADEVRPLIAQAKEWARSLGVPVGLWISDQRDAFVTGIAAEFPDVPHRDCDNHFLRDVAQPVLEADRRAKVRMRTKVRGPRAIEQAVLRRRGARVEDGARPVPEPVGTAETATDPTPAAADLGGPVVLDSGAAARGILNDDQGGPLHPPGVRMAEALTEVEESIRRDLGAKKGGSRRSDSAASPAASGRVLTRSSKTKRSSEDTSR